MKCVRCAGTGEATYFRGTQYEETSKCWMCDGTGEVRVTNFDRITASHEALAEFIFAVSDACFACDITSDNIPECCPFGDCKASKNSVLEWLKQESTE